MKFPELDTTKSVVLAFAAVMVGYVIYRAVKTGDGIAAGIGESFTKIKDTVAGAVETVSDVWSATPENPMFPATMPDYGDDQSAAETRRLLEHSKNAGVSLVKNLPGNLYDSVIGLFTPTPSAPQRDSPDAGGSTGTGYEGADNTLGNAP